MQPLFNCLYRWIKVFNITIYNWANQLIMGRVCKGRVGYVPSLLCAELVMCRVCYVPSCPTIAVVAMRWLVGPVVYMRFRERQELTFFFFFFFFFFFTKWTKWRFFFCFFFYEMEHFSSFFASFVPFSWFISYLHYTSNIKYDVSLLESYFINSGEDIVPILV